MLQSRFLGNVKTVQCGTCGCQAEVRCWLPDAGLVYKCSECNSIFTRCTAADWVYHVYMGAMLAGAGAVFAAQSLAPVKIAVVLGLLAIVSLALEKCGFLGLSNQLTRIFPHEVREARGRFLSAIWDQIARCGLAAGFALWFLLLGRKGLVVYSLVFVLMYGICAGYYWYSFRRFLGNLEDIYAWRKGPTI